MKQIKELIRSKMHLIVLLSIICFCSLATAKGNVELLNVQTRSMPGNKAQILLEFSGVPPSPNGFSMSNPSKMIFDFAGVNNNLSKSISTQKLSVGVMTGINFINSIDKTRLIVDVLSIVPYSIDVDRNKLVLTLDNDFKNQSPASKNKDYTISSLDFRRGELGEGRVIVEFSGESVPIDFNDNDDDIVVQFRGASIPDSLLRRFDVKDFGTNIDQIVVERKNDDVVMHITAHGNYDKVGYQADKRYIVETKPLSAESQAALKAQKFKFTGEKISLNFQDIPIRSVLQLIADFTNLNIVTSDSVQGNLTLKLDNIPWDQALDFILRSKGLAKRESGNVMLIGPAEEITAREQLELETQQQTQSLEPLLSEYIQINYAKASDLVTIISDDNNSLLSERGTVNVDTRTNTLLIKDTASNIISVRQMLERLDVPIKQVMIEAQIVQTTDTLGEDLGVKFNGAATPHLGKYILGVGPTATLARQFANDPSSKVTNNDSAGSSSSTSTSTDSSDSSSSSTSTLFFDFTGSGAGALGLALAKLPGGTLLDLELRASELENKSKTVARPKLMTLDQQQASIETGQDIPYTTVAQAGSTPTTTFKKAVLKLDVKPQITPNNKISMTLTINQDVPGASYAAGPAINTTTMTTNILVDDGETVVLGGIFSSTASNNRQSIPYLSDIPIIGRIFRATSKSLARTEVLIFITPKIVKAAFTR